MTDLSSTHLHFQPDKNLFFNIGKILHSLFLFLTEELFLFTPFFQGIELLSHNSQEGNGIVDHFSFLLLLVGTLLVKWTDTQLIRPYAQREVNCVTTQKTNVECGFPASSISGCEWCQQGLGFLSPGFGSTFSAWTSSLTDFLFIISG